MLPMEEVKDPGTSRTSSDISSREDTPPHSRTRPQPDLEAERSRSTESSSPVPVVVGVPELLAAQNMRRLLEAYRTLAPLTIGGPASTTLENSSSTLEPRAAGPKNIKEQASLRKLQNQWLMTGGAERRRHPSTPPPLAPRLPLLSVRDRDSSSLLETTLEGRGICCFSVGGELRLCLTQVLQLVFSAIPLNTIHKACEDLQIYCSTSSPPQLASLKLCRVLPISTTQCGLITKSDAERLCSLLLHVPNTHQEQDGGVSPPRQPRTPDPSAVRVEHNCFGTCRGLIHPQSFTTPDSPAIECEECQDYFSPARFVSHTHRAQQRGVVHWGFSRENWTSYIQVWAEYSGEEKEKAEIVLNDFKKKFSNSKRKLVESVGEVEQQFGKRRKEHEPLPHLPNHPSLASLPQGSNLALKPAMQSLRPSLPSLSSLPSLIPINENPKEKGVYGEPGLCGGWGPYLQSVAQLQLRLLLDHQLHHTRPHQQHQQLQLHHLQLQHQQQLQQQRQQQQRRLPPRHHQLGQENGGLSSKEDDSRAKRRDAFQDPGRPGCDEYMVGVAAVLAGAGVAEAGRLEVLHVVERLVGRLQKAEEEKAMASIQLRGMEERVCRLETELARQVGAKQEDETSTDGGIESGTEADDLSEKLI